MSIAFAGNNMYQFTASYLTANLHAIPIPTASAQPPNGAGIKSFPAKVVTDVCNANGYYVTMRGLGDTVVISCSVRRITPLDILQRQQTPLDFLYYPMTPC